MSYQAPKGINGGYDDNQIQAIVSSNGFNTFIAGNPQDSTVAFSQAVMDYEHSIMKWYQGSLGIGGVSIPKTVLFGAVAILLVVMIKKK